MGVADDDAIVAKPGHSCGNCDATADPHNLSDQLITHCYVMFWREASATNRAFTHCHLDCHSCPTFYCVHDRSLHVCWIFNSWCFYGNWSLDVWHYNLNWVIIAMPLCGKLTMSIFVGWLTNFLCKLILPFGSFYLLKSMHWKWFF